MDLSISKFLLDGSLMQSDSPYKGGSFRFTVSLPKDFPFKAPTVNRNSSCFINRFISGFLLGDFPNQNISPWHK